MNTITATDRKLAASLKSLSLEPVPYPGKPPHNRRRLALVLGLCAAAATAAAYIGLQDHEILRQIERRIFPAAEAPDAPAAKGTAAPGAPATVHQGALPQAVPPARQITGSGLVVAPNSTAVFALYEGRVTAIAAELGDTVNAGDVLLTLDDASARFALERARAARAAADLVAVSRRIALKQARASLDRIEILAARDAVSQQLLDEARTAFNTAANARDQALHAAVSADLAIRIAEEPVAELTIRAPFAGTVTRLEAHVGDSVLARADSVRESQSLLTITDTAHLVIDADVAETGIADLRPGLRGEAVLDGFPGQPFGIEVLRLAPVVSAEKGTITLRLSLADPPRGIRPNMAARISLSLPALPASNTNHITGENTQ